jgi:hypothetical protein
VFEKKLHKVTPPFIAGFVQQGEDAVFRQRHVDVSVMVKEQLGHVPVTVLTGHNKRGVARVTARTDISVVLQEKLSESLVSLAARHVERPESLVRLGVDVCTF